MLDNDENLESSPSSEGLDSRLCSKCKTNVRTGNSSWCRPCRNEQAAVYRARQRKKIVTEDRECAYDGCDATFLWRSSHPRQTCCCKSHYERHQWALKRKHVIELLIQPGFILCTKCGVERPASDYAPSRQHLKRSQCRECFREYGARWDKENKDKRSAYTRRSRVRRLLIKYGAPSDNYDDLLAAQGGSCACCGCSDSGARSFHVDHDHSKPESSSYRGLLCGKCNAGLGNFNDDPLILEAALRYLLAGDAG